jgi:hypothetical protein
VGANDHKVSQLGPSLKSTFGTAKKAWEGKKKKDVPS